MRRPHGRRNFRAVGILHHGNYIGVKGQRLRRDSLHVGGIAQAHGPHTEPADQNGYRVVWLVIQAVETGGRGYG